MHSRLDPLRWKALALLCLAMFMVIVDAQIVILGLPSIEADLGLSAESGQWVMSAYLLSFGGLMLLGGRSADLLGRRRMFIVGVALFLVSSLGCGRAWSGGVLIGARVVQGVSAAIMAPTALWHPSARCLDVARIRVGDVDLALRQRRRRVGLGRTVRAEAAAVLHAPVPSVVLVGLVGPALDPVLFFETTLGLFETVRA